MADYQLPILRNDGSVEENLTSNAINNILPSRYTSEGEEATEVFERVAKNVALAELLHVDDNVNIIPADIKDHPHRDELIEDIFWEGADDSKSIDVPLTEENVKHLDYDSVVGSFKKNGSTQLVSVLESKRWEFQNEMEELGFTPNSPTLMNAGDELQQLSACIAGDVPVYTSEGLKDMRDVEVGDYVLTHLNRFKRVLSHEQTGVKDTMFMSSGTHKQNSYTLEATPDHEVFSERGEWKSVEDIMSPAKPSFNMDVEVPSEFRLTEFGGGLSRKLVSDGGVVRALNKVPDRTGVYNDTMLSPKARIGNDEKLAYLFGVFIAEGNINGSSGVRFTLNKEDEYDIAKTAKYLRDVFGLEPNVGYRKQSGECVTISLRSKIVGNFFEDICGRTFDVKSIPKFVAGSSEEYKFSFLEGLNLDGITKGENWDFTFANPTLAYETLMLGRSLGYHGTFNYRQENKLSKNRTAGCRFGEGERLKGTVKEEGNENVPVFDMTVEDDHSYLAGDYFVHNCFVISPEDNIYDIHETMREAAEVFQSGGGMGYGFWTLRPKGEGVGSTGGIASGPITFMRTYDQMCETIAQGGMRRGAQMGVMKVDHPDVIEFIHAKRKDVSLAETLRLNDPDDFTHNSFREALEEARELIDEDSRVPNHLRNAVEGHLSNFNISVGVTDGFMEAVKNDDEFVMKHPSSNEPFCANEETVEMYEMFGFGEYVEVGEVVSLPARLVWDHMIEGAYENGEPGVVFIDRFNEMHSFPVDTDKPLQDQEYSMLATNPCGEQPLMEYEACNLGHINLSTVVHATGDKWVDYEEQVSGLELNSKVGGFLDQVVDWDVLDRRIDVGTHFLDNVVTMSDFPIPEIEQTVRDNRKIGLGVMGLAQFYIQIGVEYGSEVGNEIARQLMKHINHRSKEYSRGLADGRGSFANWEDSKYADPVGYREWFEHHTGESADDWEDGFPIRNHNTTTIAPTGTTSMIGNTSGGCEPIFSVARYKNVSDDVQGDEMLVEFDQLFLDTLELNGIDVEEAKREAEELMSKNQWDGPESISVVPDGMGELFITTSDLTALEHGSVQCAVQEGVDSAISKTVNAPNDATLDDAKLAFEYVYDNGGKGVTYYRDGTRTKQVLTTRADNQGSSEDESTEDVVDRFLQSQFGVGLDELQSVESVEDSLTTSPQEVMVGSIRERPDVLMGKCYRIQTGYGTMYVTVNDLEGEPFEILATIGKSGGQTESMLEGIARMISGSLRAGMNVGEVIEQLSGIRSPRVAWHNGDQVNSIPDALAKVLMEHTGTNPFLDQGKKAPISKGKTDGGEDKELAKNISPSSNGEVSKNIQKGNQGEECPECHMTGVVIQEGCQTCEICGWSKC